MAEGGKQLQAAALFRGDELGVVLASLGPNGDARDRLAAVVALLATKGSEPGKMVRGAFAGPGQMVAAAKVRDAFTTALHGCLREEPVNAGSPANTRSA